MVVLGPPTRSITPRGLSERGFGSDFVLFGVIAELQAELSVDLGLVARVGVAERRIAAGVEGRLVSRDLGVTGTI